MSPKADTVDLSGRSEAFGRFLFSRPDNVIQRCYSLLCVYQCVNQDWTVSGTLVPLIASASCHVHVCELWFYETHSRESVVGVRERFRENPGFVLR